MEYRAKMVKLLSDEAALEEIVQLVGMDALSAPDRLKLEAARSIREDFLHQNSFHEIDTYTELDKQFCMMKLIIDFYELSLEAIRNGASISAVTGLPVSEQIGRFKYVPHEIIQHEYEKIDEEMRKEISAIKCEED